MLARTVYSAIWLFVQEYIKMMLPGNTLHQIHDELVVVVGKVTVFEDRGQLKLVGSYFVMTGFGRNTEFVTLDFEFFHKCSDTWRDRAEIMILQLLVFGRRVPHQCPSCQAEVGACII